MAKRRPAKPKRHVEIIFDRQIDVDLSRGIAIDPEVEEGSLIVLDQFESGAVRLRALGDDEMAPEGQQTFWVKKASSRALHLAPVEVQAMDAPSFGFGEFEFWEFARWLLDQHGRVTYWIELGAAAGLQSKKVADEAVRRAGEMAYMSLLALAVSFSWLKDVSAKRLDTKSLVPECFSRARYMIELHGPVLPLGQPTSAKLNIYDERAALVASDLVPAAILGIESPVHLEGGLAAELPQPVKDAWRLHEHCDSELCQYMALTFPLVFKGFVPKNDPRYWAPLVELLWVGWTNHLLNFDYAMDSGSLEDDSVQEVEEEQPQGPILLKPSSNTPLKQVIDFETSEALHVKPRDRVEITDPIREGGLVAFIPTRDGDVHLKQIGELTANLMGGPIYRVARASRKGLIRLAAFQKETEEAPA
jgi:hypothetical protein